MFSLDAADRTLPPTERRRREARARGDVARSSELTSAAIMLAASAAFWWSAPASLAEIVPQMQRALTADPTRPVTIASFSDLIWQTSGMPLTVLSPLALFIVFCGATANFAQTGWLWNASAAVPGLHLRPIVSSERLIEAFGMMLRLALLSVVAWLYLRNRPAQFVTLAHGEPSAILATSARLIGELSVQLSTCLVGLGFFDFGLRFWRREQRLKMTVAERRQEQQADEVDPGIKRRRAINRNGSLSAAQSVPPIETLPSDIICGVKSNSNACICHQSTEIE